MNHHKNRTRAITRFLKEEKGQDLVEYSLLIAFLALATIGSMSRLSGAIQTLWTSALNAVFNQFAIS